MHKKDELDEKKRNEIIREICNDNKLKKIKDIGSGGFGSVFKVNFLNNENYVFAVKVIFKKNKNSDEKIEENLNIRGPNIVKINKQGGDKDKYYYYIMECSEIGSLKSFVKELKNEENTRVFGRPFKEKVGDNLIRYLTKQIINAMKTFYQGDFVHYDIKPDNILIFQGLQVKVIDFSLLKQINNNTELISGGTVGYVTPEYYLGDKLEKDVLKKQDYFAIGTVLYYLKYGEKMLQYKEKDDSKIVNKGFINSTNVTDLISIAINKIKSKKNYNKGFTNFLISLIQYKPEDRPDFNLIYRNKWLNENNEEIKIISNIYSSDEVKLTFELQKSDFLINNKKYYRKKNIDNINDKKNYKIVRNGKFKFCKKI